MSHSNGIASEIEKETIMKELLAQNEIMLEKHKKALEDEFKAQMEELKASLQTSSNTARKKSASPKKRVKDASALDQTSEDFYRAARHSSSAPQLILMESNERKALLQATLESRVKTSSVSVTTGQVTHPRSHRHKPHSHKSSHEMDEDNTSVAGSVSDSLADSVSDSQSSISAAPAAPTKPLSKTLSGQKKLIASPLRLTSDFRKPKKSQHHDTSHTLTSSMTVSMSSAGMSMNEEYDHIERKNKLTKIKNHSNISNIEENDIKPMPRHSLSRMDTSTQLMIRKSESYIQENEGLKKSKKRAKRKDKSGHSSRSRTEGVLDHKNSTDDEDEEDEKSGVHRESGGYNQSQHVVQKNIEDTTIGRPATDISVRRVTFTGPTDNGKEEGRQGQGGQFSHTAPVQLPSVRSKEGVRAVTVSKATARAAQGRLSSRWRGRTVNEEGDGDGDGDDSQGRTAGRRKSQWENEIARHIISMYATTKADASDKPRESKDGRIQPNADTEMLLRFTAPVKSDAKSLAQSIMSSTEPHMSGKAMLREELRVEARHMVKSSPSKSSRGDKRKMSSTENRKKSTVGIERKQSLAGSVTTPNRKKSVRGASGEEVHRHQERERDREAEKDGMLVVAPARVRASFFIRSRNGEKLEVRGPPRCFPIWFVSTGDVYADWTALPEGGATLQAKTTALLERNEYRQYLELVEAALSAAIARLKTKDSTDTERKPKQGVSHASPKKRRHVPADTGLPPLSPLRMDSVGSLMSFDGRRPPSAGGGSVQTYSGGVEESEGDGESVQYSVTGTDSDSTLAVLIPFWRQLVTTANAFGILCIEKNQFNEAMLLLRFAEMRCGRDDLLPKCVRQELRAHVFCAMGFFFFKRKKTRAAMTRCVSAADIYRRLGPAYLEDEALALLRLAACECQASDFKASHKLLYQVLSMAEGGRLLAEESASAKQLCIVAVAYHNLAVVQMKMQDSDAACKSSQNARKLARLCLSYSNRWLPTFHWTHQVALEDVQHRLKMNGELDDYEVDVMHQLTDTLYNPDAL